MLTQLDLQHFKCFAALKLLLRPLTLLSGVNASGKSSVMQALALLHQTMREHEWSERLILNGAAVELGTVADVVDQVHGRSTCRIGLHDGDELFAEWEFGGERGELSMAIERYNGSWPDGRTSSWEHDESKLLRHLFPNDPKRPPDVGTLTTRLLGLSYLTAERTGPRDIYPLGDSGTAPVVGRTGEGAVSVLDFGRDLAVLAELTIPGTPPTRYRQTEAWMNRFFPGCAIGIAKIPRANAATLGIRTSGETGFLRPGNTGFGLTQVLPVVIAALSAEPDGLLLIENPEVHLHPAGQAEMGEFLGQVAAAGVQVIVETHSDHVLNGIRRAIKREMLPHGDVALHFFRPRKDGERDGSPQVESPGIDANGNIDTWPDGFFDQFDKDMNEFAGWG